MGCCHLRWLERRISTRSAQRCRWHCCCRMLRGRSHRLLRRKSWLATLLRTPRSSMWNLPGYATGILQPTNAMVHRLAVSADTSRLLEEQSLCQAEAMLPERHDVLLLSSYGRLLQSTASLGPALVSPGADEVLQPLLRTPISGRRLDRHPALGPKSIHPQRAVYAGHHGIRILAVFPRSYLRHEALLGPKWR